MAVILSMTSIPARNGTLDKTLDSIAAQTVKPDEIRIYAPPHVADPGRGVRAIRMSEDLGPVMKIAAVIDHDLAPEDIVVTIDDDIVYEPMWLETLLAGCDKHREAAVGFAGWSAFDLIRTRKFHFTKEPCATDVLEGWAGVAYRVRFCREGEVHSSAPSPTHILYPPQDCRLVDDVWISGYLMVRGIERRVIRTPMAKEAYAGRPGLHHRPDFKSYNIVAAERFWGRR